MLDADGQPVSAGSGKVGMVAHRGAVPIGYHGDEAESARVFPTIDGVRWALPGDLATVEADGHIRLLGRGASSINRGGEKVSPEEVEAALKSHRDVFDAVVLGVADDRLGERVVALVQLRGRARDRRPRPTTAGRSWPTSRSRARCCWWTRSRGCPPARPISRGRGRSSIGARISGLATVRADGVQPRPRQRRDRPCLPRPRGCGLGREALHLRRPRRADTAPRQRAPRSGPRHPAGSGAAEGPRVGPGPPRAVPLQRQRVPRGHARRVPGPGRAVQRELPLRRRRAPLPAQGRAGAAASCTTRASRRPWPRCCPTCPTSRCWSRWPTSPARRSSTARSTTRSLLATSSDEESLDDLVARRPLHPLHRRHHRHAEGRAVAAARHLRRRHGRPALRRRRRLHLLRRDRGERRARRAQGDRHPAAHARRRPVGHVHLLHRRRHRRHARGDPAPRPRLRCGGRSRPRRC